MNIQLSTRRKVRGLLINVVSIFAMLAIALPGPQVVSAASDSPFLGQWEATDVDGSNMRLAIAGRPGGPYQITWTDNYISLCNGDAGIVRGTGLLNEGDPNLLEADMHLECFTSDAALDFHVAWRYHSNTNTLSNRYDSGVVTIWHRPGRPQAPPPSLNLRVNYGDNWVESFYEGGHTAWVTVTESDGVTVKATIELITEPKDYWGGETGFQSIDGVWNDAQGNSMESPPDIQPNDWVFAWVDNGASAEVQIGDITGTIDLVADSIAGTIKASWITTSVPVECLDWGSGSEPPLNSKDVAPILTNGIDTYSCSWAGEWDIQPGQNIGVGYVDPDGNWVSNAFFITNPTFVAYLPGAIEGYDWPMGDEIRLTINDVAYPTTAYSEQRPDFPEGVTRVLFEVWQNNISLKAGDHIVMSDDAANISKDTWVTNLAVTGFNLGEGTVSGTYDPSYTDFWVWLYGQAGQVPALNPDAGTWIATFTELLPGAWGGATQRDADGDGTSIDFQVPATLIVTGTGDVLADDGVCTLREAIIAANTNSPSGELAGECPAGLESATDTIILASGTVYSLTINSTDENDARDGDLDIWDNPAAIDLVIRVEGGGNATISQDAAVDDRVLQNLGATVKIEGVTLTGGTAVWSGGGIFNSGTLVINHGTITANSAPNDGGGGVTNEGSLSLANSVISSNTAFHDGGGITNTGTLTIDASEMFGNSGKGGGALANMSGGEVTIRAGSQVHNNSASVGGGLFNYGTITVTDSSVADNTAENGAGLSNWGGMVSISSSTFSGNLASDTGGGLVNRNGTMSLLGSIVDGNTAAWGGGINTSGGELTLTGTTVSNNTANNGDGGIQIKDGAMATIQNASIISGNSAPNGYGGGISNWGSTLTIDASSITGNSAAVSAGGILNKDNGTTIIQNRTIISNNTATYEGGVSNWGGSNMMIDASEISGNTASQSSGGIGNLGTMTLNASTVSGNKAVWGGGLFNALGGTITITNSIISSNTSDGGGGILNDGSLTMTGSALLGNTAEGEGDAVLSIANEANATSVTASCIAGNGNTAFFNTVSVVQNATGNWWGDASGPTHWSNPGGTGDSVSDNVNFSNWLSAPPGICAP